MSGKRRRNGADRGSVGNPADQMSGGQTITAGTVGNPQCLPAATWHFWMPLSVCVFVVSAGLLFYDLGHYPLWCDEADNALFGRAIARTGDLNAMIDHNLIANREGACLKNLRGRYQPPLPYYLTAPFVGTTGTSSFWPRVPFAICGLLSVAWMLYWMSRSELPPICWVVFSLGLLGNVSFFLYCRQCRYFALAMLLSLVIAYLYLHWNGRRWHLAGILVGSLLLLATQYLAFVGLYAALACDYLLFGRHRQRFSHAQLLWLLVPQVLIGGIIVWIYNPIGAGAVPEQEGRNLLLDKLTLLWWNLRDINSCEYGVGLLLLAAPALYLLDKNQWLLRAPVAILAYAAIVAIVSPQPVAITDAADIRYLSSIIPLCIFLTSLAILSMSNFRWLAAIPLALVAFDTNLLNRPGNPQNWRSTIYQWIEELATARMTPTQRAIEWINQKVQPGQSIWVMPLDLMTYPLMYHAPQAVYAWQLWPPAEGQFKNLPPIHFAGGAPPDYIFSFGTQPDVQRILAEYQRQQQLDYILTDTLDAFWDEQIRPELFLRSFKPVVKYDPATEAVYIYRRNGVELKGQ